MLFALRGEQRLLAFSRWMLAALMLAGASGFTGGMMKTLTAAERQGAPMEAARLVMIGTMESANNPITAFMFGAVACVCIAVGQRRFAAVDPSALAR